MRTQPFYKTPPLVTLALALITSALFLLIFAVIANAQVAVAPTDAPQQVAEGMAETLANFAATHPGFVGFLTFIGALRLCIKPIMTGIRYVVNSSETNADDVYLDKVEHSFIYTVFLFSLDWLTSIKLKAKSADAPLNKALSLFLISAFTISALALTGCAGRTAGCVARALAKDPASVHVRITTIYGTIEVARTAPNTNSPPHTVGADGTITVK